MRWRWLLPAWTMAMAGCLPLGSYVTAQQAIDAARKGQLDAFQHELTGQACDTFGTEEGMAAMREKLGRYERIEVGKPLLIAEKDTSEWTYKTIVAGVPRNSRRAEEIYTVFVHCQLMAIPLDYTFVPDECSSWFDANGAEQRVCHAGVPVHYTVGWINTCGVRGSPTELSAIIGAPR